MSKLEISLETAALIIIATLALSTASAVCETAWQETSIKGVFYCEPRDLYRSCSHLSGSKLTCYFAKEGTFQGILDTWNATANGKTWQCQGLKTEPYSRCKSSTGSVGYWGELK